MAVTAQRIDYVDMGGEERYLDLQECAERWRDGQVERGFSMALGRFGDPRDPDVVVVRCFDETGRRVRF